MPSTPSYVRLAERLADVTLVDIRSGWGISGQDVRHFPKDDPVAAEWCQDQIRRGNIEEAGKAEWDDVHEGDLAYEDDEENVLVIREAAVKTESQYQLQAAKKRRELQEKREKRRSKDDDLDGDESGDEDDVLVISEGQADPRGGGVGHDATGNSAVPPLEHENQTVKRKPGARGR